MNDDGQGKASGGYARALALTPERRKEISLAGVEARRERGSLPRAICGDDSKPLIFGDIQIQCYVLEDETRVLSLRTLQSGIGMSEGGGKGGARKIPALMTRLAEKGINIMDLDTRANEPIRFITTSGNVADGYDAKILPDICAVLIDADRKDKLDKRYTHVAERAARLQHGFATLGIIHLVDQVTGYDDLRKVNDFARIIEAFVAKEMRPYLPKFPPEYYREICRLRDIPYDPNSVRRPAYFGHITNNITYHRLAPGVWQELKKKAKSSLSVAKPHLHRFLTSDVGDPRLRDVIAKNVAVMQLSDDWFDFLRKLDRVLPPFQQLLLPFDGQKDDGTGL
jgi:hypothetical protein